MSYGIVVHVCPLKHVYYIYMAIYVQHSGSVKHGNNMYTSKLIQTLLICMDTLYITSLYIVVKHVQHYKHKCIHSMSLSDCLQYNTHSDTGASTSTSSLPDTSIVSRGLNNVNKFTFCASNYRYLQYDKCFKMNSQVFIHAHFLQLMTCQYS